MQIEQQEILTFLQQHPPFSALPAEELHHLAQQMDVQYFRAGSQILQYRQQVTDLYLIRSGVVETFRRNGALYNRLGSGALFAEQGLLHGGKVRFPANALQDSLLYLLPVAEFERLFEQYEDFSDYIAAGSEQLNQDKTSDRARVQHSPIGSLLQQPALLLDSQLPLQQVAAQMTAANQSCALLLNAAGQLTGLLTDQDIRSRAVAAGVDLQQAAATVMTAAPLCIQHNQPVFQAVLLMLRQHIQHLPVLDQQNNPVGVLSLQDLIRHESHNSLIVTEQIMRADSAAELAALRPAVQACFSRMVQDDASARMIGSAMSAIGRSFTRRLLQLAELKLGLPPVPYCFINLGSLARDEQLLVTDQDNALILDDRVKPEHGAYFAELGQFVCDGLAACGYPKCKGNIMASSAQWRLTFSAWQDLFSKWISAPSAKGLLHSSIFFDLEGLWGRTEWVGQLQQQIASQARQSPAFLASMARNALQRTPPLGFFGDFILEPDGAQRPSLDLKRRGNAPLADLARLGTLALGQTQTNSIKRLEQLSAQQFLPKGMAEDLMQAQELIALCRVRQQAEALSRGEDASNQLQPALLSELERKQLKAAFLVLSEAQKFVRFRFKA